MISSGFINSMTMVQVFSISFVSLLFVGVLSFHFGKKSKLAGGAEPSDFITNNILGLLALILGFSFSLVVNRFEVRRSLGMEEVNSITTAVWRSQVVNFKNPEEVKDLFSKYVDLRIDLNRESELNEAILKMSEMKARMWKDFEVVARKDRGELESAYMQALNEMFTISNTRYIVMIKMLPAFFYLLILAMAAASVGLMSFDRGFSNDTRHWRSLLFITLFSLVFTFIFDLDHSRSGFIQIEDPLLLLKKFLTK